MWYIELLKRIKEHNRELEHHFGPHVEKTMFNVSFKGNGLFYIKMKRSVDSLLQSFTEVQFIHVSLLDVARTSANIKYGEFCKQ